MTTDTPEDRLDAANRATFVKHYRNVLDRGIADHPGSALTVGPCGPGSPGLLADLRANAVEYAQAACQEAPATPRRKGPGG